MHVQWHKYTETHTHKKKPASSTVAVKSSESHWTNSVKTHSQQRTKGCWFFHMVELALRSASNPPELHSCTAFAVPVRRIPKWKHKSEKKVTFSTTSSDVASFIGTLCLWGMWLWAPTEARSYAASVSAWTTQRTHVHICVNLYGLSSYTSASHLITPPQPCWENSWFTEILMVLMACQEESRTWKKERFSFGSHNVRLRIWLI